MKTKTLTSYFQANKAASVPSFVPYIMAGANGLEQLPIEIEVLAENGATAIELGVPFSDPVADGPIIQAAGLAAFANQTTLKKIIATLKKIDSPVPLILMGYANSFFHYGIEALLFDLAETSVKGLIIPDLPYEHRNLIQPYLIDSDIALIQLVTLTSSEKRIQELTAVAEGFVYGVTINGTTGVDKTYSDTLQDHLKKITEISPIPVLAGFGISNREQVEAFNEVCDGVVVGSKLVATLAAQGIEAMGQQVKELSGKTARTR